MGLLIYGLILFILGVLLIICEIASNVSCKLIVNAKVKSVIEDKNSYWKGTYKHYAVYSYKVNEKEYSIKDKYSPSRNKSKYKVGDEVIIKVNSKNPSHFSTGYSISTIILSTFLITIGITLIICYYL